MTSSPRKPRAYAPDDPSLEPGEQAPTPGEMAAGGAPAEPRRDCLWRPSAAGISPGIRWGSLLLAALFGLALLAAATWFARFVSVALARDDWVGWSALGLLTMAGVAAAALLLREGVGVARLQRLGRTRALATTALAGGEPLLKRAAFLAIARLYSGRPELKWPLARLSEHARDVRDAGELLALADRELLARIDADAKRRVLAAAKRVSAVTALSPMALVSVGWVLVENLRMLRAVAALYGGRPGLLGSLRLGRMVIAHVVATGGVALTEDLLGQFLGQDLLRRLSRRLGEGAFNGALTARIGTAAIEVCRPLPFIEVPRVRARDFIGELFRRPATSPSPPTAG